MLRERVRRLVRRARGRYRFWRWESNKKAVAAYVKPLDESIERLGISGDFPKSRAAFHSMRETMETVPYGSYILALLFMRLVWVSFADGMQAVHDAAAAINIDLAARAAASLVEAWEADPELNAIPAIMRYALIGIPLLWVIKQRAARGAERRYRLTHRCWVALVECHRAFDASDERWHTHIRRLDSCCRAVERNVLRAYVNRGTMPRRSSRSAEARRHAALVAGALRKQLAQLDVEPRKALQDLGAMLLAIGEHHAEGRLTALLPEEALVGIEPISVTRDRIRDTLRVVLALAVAVGAAFVASRLAPTLGLPEEIHPWVPVGAALVAALPLIGPDRTRRIFEWVAGR